MPVVRLAGQTFGRNAGLVGPARRLEQLEQVPAQALLLAEVLRADMDVATLPEIVQVGALVGEELTKPMADDPVQGSPRALAKFVRLAGPGGVVSEVLGQRDGLARFRVNVEHHPRPVLTPAGLEGRSTLGLQG